MKVQSERTNKCKIGTFERKLKRLFSLFFRTFRGKFLESMRNTRKNDCRDKNKRRRLKVLRVKVENFEEDGF